MPIFEYRCRECGAKFEKIVSNGTSEVVCKQCSSKRVDKLLSVFAVSGVSREAAARQPTGPCACGAPRRGMCGE
jgi:putative FmdB family regulatory protein